MNLLSSTDLSRKDIEKIFRIADEINSGKNRLKLKEHSTLALFFEEPSTRTRVSFEVAIAQLGGIPIYIDAHTSQAIRGEALADTAKVLSSYCDFIGVRINSHDNLLTIAKNSRVPVINALTHLEHPTQALADCYTIYQRKKSFKNLKIAFIGDISQNTANSLMVTAAKFGACINLVGPKECRPNDFYFNDAKRYSTVKTYDSIKEGLANVDVVYTDTFVSMGDERESSRRKKLFAPYQLNRKAMSYAKSNALVMHPLPAHRGEEISAEILDGKNSVVWDQAKNKLIIEKAILLYLSL